jgi:histidinol-phosphate aminotransferase
MPVSRRSFLGALKPGTAALSPVLVAARGREAATAGAMNPPPDTASPILLDSNENPLGPGPAAMDALTRAFVDAGRYPSNARPSMTDLRAAIAKRVSVAPENIALGAGSWEILRTSVRLFTSTSRHLVTAAPSFENRRTWPSSSGSGAQGAGGQRRAARPRGHGAGREVGRPRLLLQPEQPDEHRASGQGGG